MTAFDETLDDAGRTDAAVGPPPPVLFVVFEADRPLARGARYSLVGVETVTIGRGTERVATRSADGRTLDVRVPARWMSSSHARLVAAGADFIVEDAGARNGVRVGGRLVTSAVLRENDLLEAGHAFFSVRGAPARDGDLVRDEDAAAIERPFGLRTLVPEIHASQTALLRVARTSRVPILLLGATGTGKEVLARRIHAEISGDEAARRPFVPVNCGALPPALVESLLFGHVKGAFSGAERDEKGFVRAAQEGTLFLDEIGDLPLPSQAAFLRFLQEGEVVPVGATRSVHVETRVVAATHRPLEALARAGQFRSDLMARLKGYSHRLPTLRERAPDLGVLIGDLLSDVAGADAASFVVTPEAARALLAHDWPLNVRELRQALASAVALARDDRVIDVRHLPPDVVDRPQPAASDADADGEPPASVALRDEIVALLQRHRGNVTAVARALGKAPAQIHRWMRRFDVDPDVYRERSG